MTSRGNSTECTLTTVNERRAELNGGKTIYIAPDLIEVNSDHEVLLAGFPNYIFSVDQRSGRLREVGDSIIGVVFGTGDNVYMLSVPFAHGKIDNVRGVASGRSWSVVFGELNAPRTAAGFDSTVALWHAEFQAGRLVRYDLLPTSAEEGFLPQFSSPLLSWADTLAWAIPRQRHARSDVVVFTRTGNRWTRDSLPAHRAVYAAAAHDNANGLVIAVVEPDSSQPFDQNSLFVYFRDPDGRWLKKKIAAGQKEPVRGPVLDKHEGTITLLWRAATQEGTSIRAIIDPIVNTPDDAVTISTTLGVDALTAAGVLVLTPDSIAPVGGTLALYPIASRPLGFRLELPVVPVIAARSAAAGHFVLSAPVPAKANSIVSTVVRLHQSCW